jgi:trehalose/maltose transport system permease protein
MTLASAAAAAVPAAVPQSGASELTRQRTRAAMVFLLPMIAALALVAGWPLLRSIYFSMTDVGLNNLSGGEWVGFSNYLSWTTLESGKTIYFGVLADPAWWNAVWNTVRFAFVSVLLESALGMAVALALNAEFKGRGIVRAL